tara:strand:- start:1484 stop:1771 length:288 start_codon:yes stop_codon:yes gene_type:complete
MKKRPLPPKETDLPRNDIIIDAWIVQLDSLIKHATHFRNENVRKYEDGEHEAFDAGLSMMIILMESMVKDMLPKKDVREYLPNPKKVKHNLEEKE